MEQIKNQLASALSEFEKTTNFEQGDIFVVGCSTSEVLGNRIGSAGSLECANVIFETVNCFCKKHGIFLAAQCCEHLNRALVIEKEAYVKNFMTNRVNAIPHAHAGGSFATAAYAGFEAPYVVDSVSAVAGIDIGDTFIGMHLKNVAVPVRVGISSIGEAHLTLARTRCKFVGGERAIYDPKLN
jgi:uncharacterized protein (TIGR01440 family)